MTVSTTDITSGPYDGNDVTTSFSYTFRIENTSQVQVYEKVGTAAPILLTLGTDYTVAGTGVDSGGLITRVAGALPAGSTWYIRSNYQDTQGVGFKSQGGFFPETHEEVVDKLTFLIKQLQDESDRAVRMDNSESSGALMILPDAATRANKVLVFGPDGEVATLSQTGGVAATFEGYGYNYGGDYGNGDTAPVQTIQPDIATDVPVVVTVTPEGEVVVTDAPAPVTPTATTPDTGYGYNYGSDYGNNTPVLPVAQEGSGGLVVVSTTSGDFTLIDLLAAAQTWTAGQRGEITALVDAANIATDLDLSNNFSVTLAGNRTLDNPTNIVAGQEGSIFITQDGTGSRTLSYGTYWDFAGGAAPTLTTDFDAVDRIDYVVKSATSIHAVWTGDVK